MAKKNRKSTKKPEDVENRRPDDQDNVLPDAGEGEEPVDGIRGRGSDPDVIEADYELIETMTDIEASSRISNEIDEDTPIDLLIRTDEGEKYEQSVSTYTNDQNIVDDFSDRQNMSTDRDDLVEKLEQYTGRSPEISGDDVDAAWQYADQAGEETVGASTPTPDQDIVDELGEAAGLTYDDDEPLNFEKVGERDTKRWELNPNDLTEIDDQEDMESLSALEEEEEAEDEEIVDAEAVLIDEDEEEEDDEDEDDDEEDDEDDDLAEDVDEFDLVDLEEDYDLDDDED